MRIPFIAYLQRLVGKPPINPGRVGERLAERHLKKQGYRLVARNLRSRLGEIDLLMVAPDRRTIVFIEVKTAEPGRRSSVPPEHRVGRHKQRKIAQLAARLIARHKLAGRPVRFDVVGVDLHDARDAEVRHHVAAFESPW
ncbi:MAG: YraN family protein [Phycisphaeraceae bacterium]